MTAAPHIACIILAAGRSTRMGSANKLLADLGGKPMVRRVAETALASRAQPVLVVTGHQDAEVGRALEGLNVGIVRNPDYAAGLSSSLKAGIRALPARCEATLVLLGDMPDITAGHLDRLMDAFVPEAIVVPVHAGRRGNPVLWSADYFPEMLQLQGDAGAKRLLAVHADRVREVDLATPAIFVDVDTPDALAALRRDGAG